MNDPVLLDTDGRIRRNRRTAPAYFRSRLFYRLAKWYAEAVKAHGDDAILGHLTAAPLALRLLNRPAFSGGR